MADLSDQCSTSSTEHRKSCNGNTTRTYEEDRSNSIIKNSTDSGPVVNNDHAVGRDAGSEAEHRASDASYVTKYPCENEQWVSDLNDDTSNAELINSPKATLNLDEISSNSMGQLAHSPDQNSNENSEPLEGGVQVGDAVDSSVTLMEHSGFGEIQKDEHCVEHELQKSEETDSHQCADAIDEDIDMNSSDAAQAIVQDESKPEDTVKGVGKDQFDVESLNYELQVGYRILSNMMSSSNRLVNKLFLFPVDDNFPETAAYYEKVKKPMWMFKMKEKFESHKYNDITEFMADFRLMIENCYRFNGPDNFVSKKAQKLETMMKQKVALLSKNLREKILGAAVLSGEDDLLTSAGLRRRIRNPNATIDDPSQQLLSQLRKDREMQERVDRRQKVEDRRAMELARLQELQSWEDNLIGPEIKEHLRTMWELPQIGLFVYLCMESLGLEEEVTQYQIERGLVVPRECSDFGRLMTCLLSTPHQRKNLKSFMPYHVWNSKLTEKLDYFYKVLSDKNCNHTQACYKLGFDLRGFRMMGKVNPMRRKKYHELPFLKRVWILKNYCDFCLETQQYLQKTIEDIEAVRPNDVREVLLGSDGRGYRYLNFPMFTGKDIRIFKHQKIPEPTVESLFMEDWSVDTAEKPSASSSRCSTPINQRNNRQAETPLNSLRARALLQAAESKEASPFRETSRAGSESLDSSSHQPQSENTENIHSVKPASVKKRKKTSIFTGKKKRLKIKKADSSFASAASADDSKVEEDSFADGDSFNDSNCVASEAHSTELAQKPAANNAPLPCDNIVQTEKTCDNSSSKDASLVGSSKFSPLSANQSSPSSLEPVPVSSDASKADAAVENQSEEKSSDSLVQCQQQTPAGRQLDSAYLSGESDKSARDEEELVKLAGTPSGKDRLQESTVFHAEDHQSESVSLDSIKSECRSDWAVEEVEMKRQPQIKDECSEVIETECKVKKEEAYSEENVTPKKEKCNVDETLDKFHNNDSSVKPGDLEKSENSSCEVKKLPVSKSEVDMKTEELQCEPRVKEESESKDESGGPLKQNVSKEELAEQQSTSPKHCQGEEKDADEPAPMDCDGQEKESKEAEEDSDEDEEGLPERGRIELVAESMEDIRQLMNKLSNPEPIKRGKKVYPGVIKPCEEELLANLTRFHDDLLKFEKSLVNARAGMQVKLRKEVDSYSEPRVGESKGWDSDHSQSTKDSSEDEEEEEEEGAGSKPEAETGRKSKRIKAKQQVAATTSLLTSAASKLSAITDNGTNEDSNDSFELDISSRGRLRKRRIIPNNTEDTGLRKRKLVDMGTGNSTPSSGVDIVSSSSGLSLCATPPHSTLAGSVSHPTVIQRQQGKAWPSHILSMLTSGGLGGASSPALRAQLGGQIVTSKGQAGSSSSLQQQLLAGQVFRLVSPGADGSIRALQVSGNVGGAQSLHAAPGSVIISPQNLASIRFVSSTGVVTLPRERILTAGSSSSVSATTTSSSPAQASHPVIQQLLLNKSAKGMASPSKVTFVPNVTVNGGIHNQSAQQQQQQQSGLSGVNVPKMSVVTLPSATSTLTLQNPVAAPNRSSLVKPPVVMVTPQNSSKLGVSAGLLSGASAAPVVVSQVSSTMSGGKQVLDLGSLSVTQIQQLMRNQAIQINMGGASSGPKTLLLTTGLQQLGTGVSSVASAVVTTPANFSNVRFQQQQQQQPVQQTIRPAAVATGASSLLAMINSKGQKLMTLPAASNTVLSNQHGMASHLVDGQIVIKGGAANAAITTSFCSTNPSLKNVLSNKVTLPQSVLAGKILSTSIQNRLASGAGTTIIAANSNSANSQPAGITLPVPQIISSLSTSAPMATTLVHSNAKSIPANSGAVGKDNPQQKARTIITVPLVHLSSPGKKYASNVTVKALLENRAPKKTDDDNLKNIPLSVETTASSNSNTVLASKVSEISPGSQSKENETPSPKEGMPVLSNLSSSQPVLNPLSMPLSVNTGGLECATSEVIVPTVHIKVPSPNTLPSVLHNKNGTTIVQSTKVPIAMASEARAPDTISPSSGSSLMAGPAGISQPANSLSKAIVVPVSSVSLSGTSQGMAVAGASLQQAQQQGVKNVMLKVTPQSGGSGQFVQGFMTSRGLVIPQSALVQQQQSKNVILANVAQNGTAASCGQVAGQQAQQVQGIASLPVQQTGLNGQPGGTFLTRPQIPSLNQPQQPLQVLGAAQNSSSAMPFSSQIQKGTVISSGGLKFMLVNPVGQTAPALAAGQQTSSLASNLGAQQVIAAAQQTQTSTPAAELVKQIAANSIQVQSGSQAGLMAPTVSSGLSPRLVQKSNVVLRAPPSIVRMPGPGVVVSTSTSPRVTGPVFQQAGLASGGILSGQSVIGNNVSPSNISPQLAAQILALQQQQQQQQQGISVASGKPAAVVQQPQQQNQPGVPSVVTLQLQQLGQLFSSLSQLQPGGMQQQQAVTPALSGGQAPGQVVQLSLNTGQTLMPGGSHPQTPQLVKVAGGQVSPQIQLTNGQLQSSQGAGLLLQQQQATQNFMLQQKPVGQSTVVSGSIGLQQQPSPLTTLLNPQQQQQQASIIKLPQQVSIAGKPQLTVSSSLSSAPQALQVLQAQQGETISSSTGVSLSPSQGFVVSPVSTVALPVSQHQQQVQFVLNQSSLASLPVASSIATGVSAFAGLNKLPGGNIRRVIRADSSLLQTSLATSTPANISSPAVVLGGSNQMLNASQLQGGSKQGLPQMFLPNSAAGTGQILISPMKLGASPQANMISPLKLLGGLQVTSSASSVGQGGQIFMNSNQLPGTILGKPSVIYAGPPAQVQGSSVDKSDANKMTQILLGQSNSNLLQVNKDVNVSATPVINSHQQLLVKSAGQVLQAPTAAGAQIKQLPANVTGLGNVAGAKATYLYKVGEQYFSPAGPLTVSGSQLGPPSSLPGISSPGPTLLPSPMNPSKPDVQLLVPPACIEASEKMLLQGNRNVNAPSGMGKLYQPPTPSNEISSSSNSGSVNGANFSFSLSGPVSLDKSQPAASPSSNSSQTATNGHAPHQVAGVLRDDGAGKMQLKQHSVPTSGGDAASVSTNSQQQQQQVVSTAATTGDEEEAAMNLLTLANQAVGLHDSQ
ncbi:hypothetical protein EGW08_021161 [Elysia chlorotica]|uniref:Bromo domain-containing protein n=1 Tax=Elysia chlorotica TaxID=188477 RepID=A0A433SPL4_ELYCH|nr:hypothetical protein EGW08_021161 [Elysia chlorotica]